MRLRDPALRRQLFVTDDLLSGLGPRSARGGAYTAASTGFNFVVTTISTILVTRELTDEDFGLYGMVLVFTGFASMFVDLGLARAVVQKPEVTHPQVSTLFWINVGIATLLALLVVAATPLVVWFYNEPRLTWINVAMSGLFVVHALGQQHGALLQRRMEFGRTSLIAACASPAGAIAAVIVAFADGGHWALVSLPAVSALFHSAGLWIACPWAPSLPRRGTGVRSMLAFGGNVTASKLIRYFSRNADNAMLGFAWGAGPLGLYTRAYSLMMLPASKMNAPLTNVLVPALSRLKGEPERYARVYLRAVSFVAVPLTGFVSWLLLVSPELIPRLLGQQWGAMTPVFLALGPAALLTCTNAINGWLYLSYGHVERELRWSFVHSPTLLAAMAIGVQWGALGMAVAVSTAFCALKPFSAAYAARSTPVPIGRLLLAIYTPIAVFGFIGLAGWVVAAATTPAGRDGGRLLLGKTAVFAAVTAATFALTPWGRDRVREGFALLKQLRQGPTKMRESVVEEEV